MQHRASSAFRRASQARINDIMAEIVQKQRVADGKARTRSLEVSPEDIPPGADPFAIAKARLQARRVA